MSTHPAFAEMLSAVVSPLRCSAARSAPAEPSGAPPGLIWTARGRYAAADVGPCPLCREGRGWVPREVQRPDLYGPGHHATEMVAICPCAAVRAHAEQYSEAKVPAGLSGASLAGFQVEGQTETTPDGRRAAVSLLWAFLDALQAGRRPAGILLCGPPGRGKSHLLAALVREATAAGPAKALRAIQPVSEVTGSQGPLVRWISATAFGAEVSLAMGDRHSTGLAELEQRLLDVPLLVVDELGDGDPGRLGSQVLAEVLRLRRDAALPVAVATNYRPTHDSLGTRVPPHLASRLALLPVVTLTGIDWRTRGAA